MTPRRFLSTLAMMSAAMLLGGCFDMPAASVPEKTWRPGEEESCAAGALEDPQAPAWSRHEHVALRAALERGEPAVLSALGCRVDVIPNCTTSGSVDRTEDHGPTFVRTGGTYRALDLQGPCPLATHVVDKAIFDKRGRLVDVSVHQLSLDGFDLTGPWEGTMRQPGGPYPQYSLRVDLSRTGDRLSGTSRLATKDGSQWGILELHGRIQGNTVYLADTKVIDQDVDLFLGWCMKGAYAVVDPRAGAMQGAWRALACTPGTIDLGQVSKEEDSTAPREKQVGAE